MPFDFDAAEKKLKTPADKPAFGRLTVTCAHGTMEKFHAACAKRGVDPKGLLVHCIESYVAEKGGHA